MKQKPNLSFWKLWNLSFGFFGVQIAYALQTANVSRIFATLGADPHSLSYFWILPPLIGMIVQPIVGTLSDKTWTKMGRRLPYLLAGALVAVLVMCLLPNSGSLGLTKSIVLWGMSGVMLFGLVALMFLDTSLNMAMQPFKMLVGDMVNEEQKPLAYSIQSFLCNAGSVAGFFFPAIFTAIGISNEVTTAGQVADSVIWSFYVGAAILIVCVLYTLLKVREWNPQEYAEYNAATEEVKEEKANWFVLLKNAPSTFWKVGLVQFFSWAAFLYMWSYVTGAVSEAAWGTADASTSAYQTAATWTSTLYGIQAMGSVAWAMVLARLSKHAKMSYAMSLLLGGIGFAIIPLIHDQYLMILPFLLIGCGWAAMLSMPFSFVTNALQGYGHMGTYLGLFNCAICLPQIIASILGGTIMSLVGGQQTSMMYVAGLLLILGSLSVGLLKKA